MGWPAAASAFLLVVLSSCGDDGARYASPRELAAALDCAYRPFTSVLGPGTEQGACVYAGADLSLTTTSRPSQTRQLAERIADDPQAGDVTTLVGDGWLVVSRDAEAVRQAQRVLGGDVEDS